MKTLRLRPLMLGGTGSDVGKSVLVAGLCRIFKQDGYSPAPFKAQNMALNSYVTPDGLELGRAQAVQAEAAGIECMAEMNPVLLKPMGDCVSQVVLLGKPVGNRSARDYFANRGRKELADEVHKAYDRLASIYNPIVMEGAGSIAEINLLHLDIVNMPMAEYADAAVILVADISRGGVFASVYGSIMLLPPKYRKLVKGVIINKFRGDGALFAEGRRMLEEICGVPVIGIMPYLPDLQIEEEDSYYYKRKHCSDNQRQGLGASSPLQLKANRNPSSIGENDTDKKIKVAIVKLSHISNFTDFDPLENDSRINLFYTLDPDDISHSDIIILPGTKATISDLAEIYECGVAQAIVTAHKAGKTVIGICGGYQMMGSVIDDPDRTEGEITNIKGLGLLPVETIITKDKLTRRTRFQPIGMLHPCDGYEIHMGKSTIKGDASHFARLDDGRYDGCRVSVTCFGTYMHGLFENKDMVDAILAPFAGNADPGIGYKEFKDGQYNRLADEMRKCLDIDLLYKIITE